MPARALKALLRLTIHCLSWARVGMKKALMNERLQAQVRSGWDDFRNFLLETAENVPDTGQEDDGNALQGSI
jgi:hypothetical protein